MRSLATPAALSAAVMALLVPAALAAKPGTSDKPGKPRPEKVKGNVDKTKAGEVSPTPDALPLPSAPPPVPIAPAHPEHTALGETVAAARTSGTIRVRLPGDEDFEALPADTALPVGSSVDATAGLVEIGSETSGGGEQHAVVTGSVFRIDQELRSGGVTDLVLQGGDFSGCDDRRTARAASRRRSTVVRGLWAAGKGRFRTRGRRSVASVRGTRWATVERCHSTTVRVFDGIVDVRDLLTGRTVTLRAGERHVASTLRRP